MAYRLRATDHIVCDPTLYETASLFPIFMCHCQMAIRLWWHTLVQLNSVTFPMVTNTLKPLRDGTQYRSLVGKLLYLTVTRPDTAFSVYVLFQFMFAPCVNHMHAAHEMLQYIKKTPKQGIFFFISSKLELKIYCNSDWGTCLDTRKSVAWYCFFLENNILSWKIKKQDEGARSTPEAEYRALSYACCEAVWLMQLLRDMGLRHYNRLETVSNLFLLQ